MVFARFRPSLTSTPGLITTRANKLAGYFVHRRLISRIHYGDSLSGLDLKYFSEWTEIWYKKRDECQMFFSRPVHLSPCNANVALCGSRERSSVLALSRWLFGRTRIHLSGIPDKLCYIPSSALEWQGA